MKAVWSNDFKWEGGEEGSKVHRSADGRVFLSVVQRYAVPETWFATLIIYGPNGRADEQEGQFAVTLQDTFDNVVTHMRKLALTAGLITEQPVH